LVLRRNNLSWPTCLRQNHNGRGGDSTGNNPRSGSVQVADVACTDSGIPTGGRWRTRAAVL